MATSLSLVSSPEPSEPVRQQLELLQRTVDEHARALASVGLSGPGGRTPLTDAEVVAQLRRARLEIRGHTGHVSSSPRA